LSETVLYSSPLFTLGEFRCPPGHERWRRPNVIGSRSLAAFPLTSVVIRHEGNDAVLANPNHVVFYRGGERYHRTLHDRRGDHCLFVAFDTLGVAEMPFTLAPSAAGAFLRLRTAAEAARAGAGEALAIEEAVCLAVASSIEAGLAMTRGSRKRPRRTTQAERKRLVERAKTFLTENTTRRDSLATIARALNTSEFHLARVFRATTGYTLHAYRTHLRLRTALERLPRHDNLTQLAAELGFNSHSHFSDSFRATFGVSPSRARAASGGRELSELSRILEAPARLRS
jgi:AraC family transcriptional regulator